MRIQDLDVPFHLGGSMQYRVICAAVSALVSASALLPGALHGQLIDPPLEAFEEWTLGPEPIAVIGKDPQTEEELIGELSFAVLLEDGRVVIADDTDSSLRLYSPDGSDVRRVARSGEGPGEFQNIRMLDRTVSGGFWGFDRNQSRVSIFDEAGDHVETRIIPRMLEGVESSGSLRLIGIDAEGNVIQGRERYQAGDPRAPQESLFQDSMHVWLFPVGGGTPHRMGAVSWDEKIIWDNGISVRPFAHHAMVAGAPHFSNGRDPELVSMAGPSFDPSGFGFHAERTPMAPRPDGRTEVQGERPSDLRTMPWPEFEPMIWRMYGSADGHIWLLLTVSEDGEERWLKFTTDGSPIAQIVLPEGRTPGAIISFGADRIAIRNGNEFGEIWLEIWPLVPVGG